MRQLFLMIASASVPTISTLLSLAIALALRTPCPAQALAQTLARAPGEGTEPSSRIAIAVLVPSQLLAGPIGFCLDEVIAQAALADGSVPCNVVAFEPGALASAMLQAGAALRDDAPRAYRHLLVIVDLLPLDDAAAMQDIHAARDALIGRPGPGQPPMREKALVHQVNALAIAWPGPDATAPQPQALTRAHVKEHIAESVAQINPPNGIDGEKNIAFVAHFQAASGTSPWVQPQVLDLVERLFLRMTACPGDYNRDGVSDPTPPPVPGLDWDAFITAYGLSDPYADWNFDGVHKLSPPPTAGNNGDWAKFSAGFSAGCPNN